MAMLTCVVLFAAVLADLPQTASSVGCANPPPGIRRLLTSVDISRLDLVPLTTNVPGGFKHTILAMTCDKDSKWTSPDGTVYDLPDQVSNVVPLASGMLSSQVSVSKSYEEARDKLKISAGVEAAIYDFSFSLSASYKKMQKTMTESNRYFVDTVAYVSASGVYMRPAHVLDMEPDAQSLLDGISGDFNSNPEPYKNFVKTYGTHYFEAGKFGGSLRMTYETSSDYFSTHTDQDVEVNAQAGYAKFVSASVEVETENTQVNADFSSKSVSTVKYYGGSISFHDPNSLKEWAGTVAKTPWLLSGTLKPISDLVRDDEKKASLKMAIDEHIMRDYLTSLNDLIGLYRLKTNDAFLSELEQKIREVSASSSLNMKDAEELKSLADHNFIVPTWFTQNTKLCFRWQAEYGEGAMQCGRQYKGQFCAGPNDMTPWYLDDTTWKLKGGCYMQWGLVASGHPEWFNKAGFCFYMHSEGALSYCGDKGVSEDCVYVNNFTPYHLDRTDYKGKCYMSWKFVTPASSPLWLRLVTLCFEFTYESWTPYPESCGFKSSAKKTCQNPNSWMEHYVDNSWAGDWMGCYLKWGLKLP